MPVSEILDKDRKLLLQLTGSNPAINFKEYRAKGLLSSHPDIAAVLFELLDEKHVFYEAIKETGEEFVPVKDMEAIPVPADVLSFPGDVPALNKRLQKTLEEAKLVQEEQGVNILYLAFGYLGWKEDDQAEKLWRSPLVLLPVRLDKKGSGDAAEWSVVYNEEDIEPNYSLLEALRQNYKLELPPMPEWEEFETSDELRLQLNQWTNEISKQIAGKQDWVLDTQTVLLSFFSFAKFQMYQDLAYDKWAACLDGTETSLIRELLHDGFRQEQAAYEEGFNLDRALPADQPPAVLDMDSSQASVLLEARNARCLVVQGPPGTGKSQTITNIIADAIAAGKKVLFVAEKMAALNVVKDKLTSLGLGPVCLELHGNKARKTVFMEELRNILENQRNAALTTPFSAEKLNAYKDDLRKWSDLVCMPSATTGYTPYELFGLLLWGKGQFGTTAVPSMQSVSDTEMQFREYAAQANKTRLGTQQQCGTEEEEVILFQHCLQEIGSPAAHPFFGVTLKAIPLDSAQADIRELTAAALQKLKASEDVATALSGNFPWLKENTVQAADKTLQYLVLALSSPAPALFHNLHQPWIQQESAIREVLQAGEAANTLKALYQPLLLAAAWDTNVLEARTVLATTSNNFFTRLFNGPFKRARKLVKGLFIRQEDASAADLLQVVDAILSFSEQKKKTEEHKNITAFFGADWQGLNSDWPLLRRSLEWSLNVQQKLRSGTLPDSLPGWLAGISNVQELQAAYNQLSAANTAFKAGLSLLRERLSLSTSVTDEWKTLPLSTVEQKLQAMDTGMSQLPAWISFYNVGERFKATGKEWLVQAAYRWKDAPALLPEFFRFKIWEYLLEQEMKQHPMLHEMTRGKLDSLRDSFSKADKLLQGHYKIQLINKHAAAAASFGNAGQAAFVRKNLYRKRNIPPIRKFMAEAFDAIASVKPVFMMSPLSVAGYLEAKPGLFDFVIFDEASQVEPVDAYGAILRGKQVIVVGDTKQMPPTSFFKKALGNDDTDTQEEESSIAGDMQSIMELMISRNARSRSLRWHYRSRHESLIAVSNEHFYTPPGLLVYPSAYSDHDFLGLKMRLLSPEECPYEGKGTNKGEAKAVAQEVLQFAHTHPDKSLGVVAFNIMQKDAIKDEVDKLARQDATLHAFINKSSKEPFFIKNLENVQGDERDVIFISIGYGKTASAMSYVFGALNKEGGERRFNVLITRAKLQNLVFCNFTADDLDLNRTASVGVKVLKSFLYYAEHRKPLYYEPADLDTESVFEEQVVAAIRQMGYETAVQVGSKGYRIDIAIKHPEKPGRYVLAVECDGAAYHSAQSARDRDRLRQSVLEGLGWRFYRVWSANWFYNQAPEIQKLKAAIEEAVSHADAEDSLAVDAVIVQPQQDVPEVVITTAGKLSGDDSAFKPYTVVDTKSWRRSKGVYELKGPVLERYILDVIEAESPVHTDRLFARIAAFQETRLGSGIRQHLHDHLQQVVQAGHAVQKNDFIWSASMKADMLQPRNHAHAPDKDIDKIAPEELDRAFMQIMHSAFSAGKEELISEVAGNLGFGRLTASVQQCLEAHLAKMIQAQMFITDGDRVSVPHGS